MGGYGSGRRRAHRITGDCIIFDTATMNRLKLFTGDLLQGRSVTWSTVGQSPAPGQHLAVVIQRYGGQTGPYSRWGAAGHMVVAYDDPEMGKGNRCLEVPLVTTTPQYGGARWWFLAPCCGQRVRALYIPAPAAGGLKHVYLLHCRRCLDLHYASQCQPAVERHKTYERYLLSQCFLSPVYDSLPEHYLSPEERDFHRDKGRSKIMIALLKDSIRMAKKDLVIARILLKEAIKVQQEEVRAEAEQQIIDLGARIAQMEVELQELAA